MQAERNVHGKALLVDKTCNRTDCPRRCFFGGQNAILPQVRAWQTKEEAVSPKEYDLFFCERNARLELVTFGLGSQRSTN